MAGFFPSINDPEYILWKKIALNFYNYAFSLGLTGINPPSPNDTKFDLQRKITYITGLMAS